MDPRMMMRKKAMDMMMKEGPGMKMPMKKPPMAMEMESDEQSGQGFEQMMVTPEEKEMILSMREKSGAEEESSEAEMG